MFLLIRVWDRLLERCVRTASDEQAERYLAHASLRAARPTDWHPEHCYAPTEAHMQGIVVATEHADLPRNGAVA